MRNLKRMLCLALTVVMLVGMMVVGAGAAGIDGFGDKAEIEHKDAVALLVELGVINGNNDGNFYPGDRLTREQMAKIAYLVMNVNQNFSIYEGTASALTDVAGRWSTGAIAWCNANGVIAGGNDGTFSPEGTLTVAQAQTFLLRTLGYDNTLSGLTGTGWDINAGILATERGLMKGLTGLRANDFITRDQVCQMAFNAIFAQGVVVEKTFNFMTGQMVATGYKTNDKGEYTGTTKAESVFGLTQVSGTASGVNAKGEIEITNEKGEKVATIPADASLVGCAVTAYTRGGEVVTAATSNNSTVIATIDKATYDSKVGANKTYIPADGLTFFTNGVSGAKADMNNGSVIELVNTNDDGKFEVARITNKTVVTLEKDPTVKDGKITSEELGLNKTDASKVVGIDTVKAGDVVLYVTVAGVTTVEKADIATGKVTAITNGNTYTVNGNKLALSKLAGAAPSIDPNFKDEYNFYLDNSGNIVAMAKAGEAPVAAEVQYAVALDYGYKGSASGEIDAVNNTTYQVKLLLPNGDTTVVEMASITVDDTKYTPTDKDNTLKPSMVDQDFDTTTEGNDEGLKKIAIDQLVSYTVKDNKYDITVLGTATAPENGTDLNGGKANFAESLIGNKNTVFLIKVKGEKSYRVVTGVAGLPTSTTDKGNGITKYDVVTNASDFVILAYLEIAGIDGESRDQVAYLVDGTKWTETAEGYEIAAIVDGEATTLVVGADDWKNIQVKDGMVTYTSVDGKVTSTTEYDDTKVDTDTDGVDVLKDITSVTGGVIKFANGGTEKIYQLADDAVIYVMSKGKAEKVTADKIPTRKDAVTSHNAYIEVEAPGSDMITLIYVLPAAKDDNLSKTPLDMDTYTQATVSFTEAGTKTVDTAVDYTYVMPGKGSGLKVNDSNGQEWFNMDWVPAVAEGEETPSWITKPGDPAYPSSGKYAIYKVELPQIDKNDHYKVTKTGWGGMDNSAIDRTASGDITEFYIIVDSTTTKITIEVGGTTANEYDTTYVVNLPGWTK